MQHLSRRAFLRLSAAAIGVSALAACAAPAAPVAGSRASGESSAGVPAPAAEAITINFVVDIINEGHVAARDKWSKEFAEANPGVTVNHQPTPSQDYNTKIQTLFAAGTPPDAYRYLQEVVPIITVVAKKMHLQLDDFVNRDNYKLDEFRKDAVGLYQWEGGLFALPRDYGNQNLFLNLDIFGKAGIEPPPWNGPKNVHLR